MSTKPKKRVVKPKQKPKMGGNIAQLNMLAKQYHVAGDFQKALQVCLQATRLAPKVGEAWLDAAVNCIKLARWDDAVVYANKAQQCGTRTFRLYDTLSHAYGMKRLWDKVQSSGLKALLIRDQLFSKELPVLADVGLPEKPSVATRNKNIIAFALFGGSSKYCEPAILNAQQQSIIYPNWTCRFYIDETVPELTVERLKQAGAEVILVADKFKQLPGPMWRFLALNDRSLHRVIFRDADSVISKREASAVAEWIDSDKYFHCMRDSYSHTELILAGLWGAVVAALPPITELLDKFLKAPISSVHFADQFFLREYVWPYVKQSVLQHDSMFGFLETSPFPDGARPEDFHVGYSEGSVSFAIASNLADGTAVQWSFVDKQAESKVVCSYPAVVQNGKVVDYIPARYGDLLELGKATIVIAAKD